MLIFDGICYFFPTQSQDESRQQLREYEETKKQIEEDADREILDIKNKYERRLREEKEANLRLKGETGIMRKKVKQDLDTMWMNRPDHHLSLHFKERKKIRVLLHSLSLPLPLPLLNFYAARLLPWNFSLGPTLHGFTYSIWQI